MGYTKRAFQCVISDSSVTVFRDRVWVKPWHLMVVSPGGRSHLFFWTRRRAVGWAKWMAELLRGHDGE